MLAQAAIGVTKRQSAVEWRGGDEDLHTLFIGGKLLKDQISVDHINLSEFLFYLKAAGLRSWTSIGKDNKEDAVVTMPDTPTMARRPLRSPLKRHSPSARPPPLNLDSGRKTRVTFGDGV